MKGQVGYYWRRNGVYYLAFGLVASIVSAIAWQVRVKVSEEEKIDFLLVTHADNDEQKAFRSEALENKPEYIYEVNFRFVMPESKEIGQLFGTYGTVEADCFLLIKDVLDEEYIDWSSFLPLSSSARNALGDGKDYFYKDGTPYGVKTKSGVKEEEVAYLFFASSSPHLGPLKEGSPYDGAYTMAKGFLL